MRGEKLYCKQLRQENAETKSKEDANMKKLIAFVLGLVMCLSLCAANAESAEPVKLSIWVAENLKVEDWETNAQTLWLEEQGNFDLSFNVLSSADYATKVGVALTVGDEEDLPDIILGGFTNSKVWEFAQNETIVPLTEYYNNPELAVNINQQIINCGTDYTKQIICPDGNIYGIARLNQSYMNEYPDKLWIYKPWLDALGEEIPTTTEDFYRILKKVSETDLNGNGKQDEIPMLGSIGDYNRYFEALMNSFVYAGGLNYTMVSDEGVMSAAFATEEWKNGLAYIAKLFDEKCIIMEALTMDDAQATVLLTGEEQLAFSHSYFSANGSVNSGDYIYIEPLVGPEGVQWATFVESAAKVQFLVTSNCENPEAAFRLGDLLSSEIMGISQRWGLQGVNWDYAANVDMTGLSATVAGWEPSVFAFENDAWWKLKLQNNSWRQTGPYVRSYGIANGLVIDPTTLPQNTVNLNAACKAYQDAALHPKNVPAVLNFTSEEEERILDIETALLNYVKEFRANVFAGNIDLDAEWDNYLKELDKIGLDTWIEVYQTAYDRMYK